MLYPSIVNESMLLQTDYRLRNNEIINVRIASETDLEDIIEIQKACYNGEAPWGRIAVASELRNVSRACFLICHHYGKPVAFIGLALRKESIHVTNIATNPQYQKNGIATFLIEMGAEIGRKLRRNLMTLEVRASNTNAMNLYRKIGFGDGRIKKNYYHNNGEDALEMSYRINETDEMNDAKSLNKFND